MKPPENKAERGWKTKAEIAEFFDTTARNFDATLRRHAGRTKQSGGKLYFYARELLEGWKSHSGKTPGPGTDPLLIGGDDSPALEEYRKARARLAWMEVNERERTHIPLSDLEPALMQLTGLMRRAGDRLARQYGNDAAMLLNEAVDQWEASLAKILPDDADAAAAEETGAGDTHPAPANA